MGLRGENIGTAYVRILADGTGLDQSIRDSFKDQDDVIDGAGNRHAQRYTRSFNKEMRSKPNQTALRNSLSDALAKNDVLDGFIHSKQWRDFRAGLGRQYGDAGHLAGKNLEQELIKGMSFDQLKGRLGNVTREISRAVDQIISEEAKVSVEHAKQEKENLLNAVKWRQADIANLRSYYNDRVLLYDRMIAGTEENDTRFKSSAGRKRILAELAALGAGMKTFGIDTALTTDRLGDHERALLRLHPGLRRTSNLFDSVGDKIGKAFGKGSRNDFVNVIGSMVGGLFKIGKVIPEVLMKLADFGTDIKASFTAAGGGLRGLVAAGGTGLKAVGSNLYVLAGALAAALLLIGPLLSGLSLLAGVATALASSIGFALVGSVGALAGAVLPVAAAVGGLALAFSTLSAEQKKSLAPTKAAFASWQDAANRGLFNRLGDQMKRLGPIMESLSPIIRKVGTQLGRQFELAFDAMNSGGKNGPFAQFRQALDNFLPDATKRIGDIIRQLAGGMGGLFRGLIPITREFLGWLDGITERFSKWANSARGQNSIKEFFRNAGNSAREFGGFLLSVSRLLGTIMSAGRSTGDSLFGSMTDSIDRWNAALKANPDMLNNWFDSAKKFGRAIGDALVAIGQLFALLDTNTGRFLITLAFKGLAASMTAIGGLLYVPAKLMDVIGGIGHKSSESKPKVDSFAGSLDQISGAATRATRALALQKLQQSDTIDMARQFGISTRDLVSASLGEKDAIQRVNGHLKTHGDLLKSLTGNSILANIHKIGDEYDAAGNKIKDSARAARDAQEATTSWKEALAGIKNKNLRIAVKAAGMDLTFNQLKRLNKQFDLTPKQVRTIIKATGTDMTNAQIKEVMKRLGILKGTKTNPKVTLDKKEVDRKVPDIVQALTKVQRTKTNPKVGIDDKASAPLKGVDALAKLLATRRPTIPVHADTNPARTALDAIQRQVNALYGKTIVVRTQHMDTRIGAPKTAIGGLFNGAQVRLIGEAGPEAVVPLNRPLSQVDPAVRALSAIAQGKAPGMARGGVVGNGRTLNFHEGSIQVVTPNADSRAVAADMVNRLVAVGY